MLLYANAAFSLFTLIGIPLGGSAYYIVPLLLSDSTNAIEALAVLGGLAAYVFGGLGIANGQKIGWKVGVVVAAGAVLLPVLALARGFNLGSGYIISFIFDGALLVALLHPQSREYQRIWFDGPSKPAKQPRRR